MSALATAILAEALYQRLEGGITINQHLQLSRRTWWRHIGNMMVPRQRPRLP